MGVEMTEQDHAGRLQPLPDVTVVGGNVVEQLARCGDGFAGDTVEILEPDRDPEQRRNRFARGDQLVGTHRRV